MARARTAKKSARKRGAPRPQDLTRRPSTEPKVPEGWTPRITDEAQLDEVLRRLPASPGVYLMRDRKGECVYVGKARSLRARVRQYFSGHDTRLFVPMLASLVGDIETVVLGNEKEALLLENNLIKEHRPRFNVKLRDDSNYLVLRLDPRAEFPRLELVRSIKHDGAYYFGPYHSARSARSTLRVVNRHFKLRTCTDYTLHHRKRPCLQYQIDRCPAPCVYDVEPEAYGDQVKDVSLFLAGRHRELITGLRKRMEGAAETLQFETAARLRDQLRSLEAALQGQRIVGTASLDQDVVGMYREGGQVDFVVLHVRQGKLLASDSMSNKGMELPDREVLGNFLLAYYERAPFVPDEVLLPFPIAEDDAAPLLEWLHDTKGRRVALVVPERGDRKQLIALANRNAASNFASRRNQREDTEAALERLQKRLGLSKLPRAIECYDVSHIQGQDTVASMVVFVDGLAVKSRYRSFKVRGVDAEGRQNDDFASMYEVLGRRFRRALVRTVGEADDEDAWALPDLVVIDGGKGQLGRVVAAMQDLGVPIGAEGIDVVALAKERRSTIAVSREGLARLKEQRAAQGEGEDAPGRAYEDWAVSEISDDGDAEAFRVRPERVFVPGIKDPIVLRPGSSERYLMERVRDEAHRFAVRLHRKRRTKRSLRSALDEIEGVGPALKRALVQHFGSVAAIRNADPEALAQVRGIGSALAKRIHTALSGG
jgi:excinuclease ABC subunit C